MHVQDAIRGRRSVRRREDIPVGGDEIERLIDAGRGVGAVGRNCAVLAVRRRPGQGTDSPSADRQSGDARPAAVRDRRLSERRSRRASRGAARTGETDLVRFGDGGAEYHAGSERGRSRHVRRRVIPRRSGPGRVEASRRDRADPACARRSSGRGSGGAGAKEEGGCVL